MKKTSFNILRIGLSITFIWIGILILKQPEAWGGYLQSWALELLPIPLKEMMIATAFLDILIGFFLLFNFFTWIASFVGSMHLIIVLITSGINEGTIRDIGLLGAIVTLTIETVPKNLFEKIKFFKKKENL